MSSHDPTLVWQIIAQWAQVVAVSAVGYFAWKVGQKQNNVTLEQARISQRLLDLEDFCSVNIAPMVDGRGNPYTDRMCIQNLGVRPVVLVSHTINGDATAVSCLIAAGKFYTFSVPPAFRTPGSTMTVMVVYEDIRRARHVSNSKATLTAEGWLATTDRNEAVSP